METLQRTANRGSISTGYDIDNSLKLESDNSEYLDNRHHSAGNRRTWTLSFWIKRTELGTTQKPYDAGNLASIAFLSTDKIQIENSDLYLATDRVFRDTSAWYHIVLLNDSTQSTASNRAKLWINGVQETSFYSETYMAQNQEGNMNSATSVSIGGGGGAHVNGYMAELFFVDGQALAPTDFGEYDEDSGIWKPKEYDGTLSGTSIKLDFSNSSALWEDSSGLSGNGTAMSGNNITSADQATDSPTNNFCTPLLIQPFSGTDTITHTEGGTKLTTGGGTGWRTNMSTMSLSSGKWYFEAKHTGTIDGDAIMTSIVPTARFGNSAYASFYGGQSSGDGIGWYWDSTRFRYDDGSAISPPTNTVNSGDILGIALDMDNNFVYSRINGGAWHNNGSADGDPTSGSSGTGGFAVADEPHMICTSMYQPLRNFFVNYGGYNAFPVSSAASDANGYGVFEYAPPSGYYAICTKNLAEFG
jgi:hypothetical protein